MRITLIITSLGGGGAERALVLLAQGLVQRGYAVTVITLSGEDTDCYLLHSKVKRIGLDLRQKSPTILHQVVRTAVRLMRLRQAVQVSQPDMVISFMSSMNIYAGLALFQTKYPIIGTEHCSPTLLPAGYPWELFRRPIYRRLQRLVSVSQGIDDEFTWLAKAKRSVIYNPFLPVKPLQGQFYCPKGADPTKKWITAMGRFVHAKGFDILLTAFQKVADQHPDWQLLILGEGELRSELEALQKRLNLSKRLVFVGRLSDPFPLLQRSKLFVLSSRTEGLPMALGEALACGLPAIATDCSKGIRELIQDNINGLVVPNQNVAELAAAMHYLMANEIKRDRLASQAPKVLEKFSLDKVMDQWEALMTEILQE